MMMSITRRNKYSLSEYKLCYITKGYAYFTTVPLNQQSGEEWDRPSYESIASTPDFPDNGDLMTIVFDAPMLQRPCDGSTIHSPYSVNAINVGQVAWLRTNPVYNNGYQPIAISAGTNPEEFCRLVRKSGGSLYLNTERLDDESLEALEEAIALGASQDQEESEEEQVEALIDEIGLEAEFAV